MALRISEIPDRQQKIVALKNSDLLHVTNQLFTEVRLQSTKCFCISVAMADAAQSNSTVECESVEGFRALMSRCTMCLP